MTTIKNQLIAEILRAVTFSFLVSLGVACILGVVLFSSWLIAAGVLLVMTLFLFQYQARKWDCLMAQKIDAITDKALAYARGENPGGKVSSIGDFGKIEALFERIARVLRERMEEADSEKAKMSLILEHVTEGVLALGEGYKILLINKKAEEILSLNKQTALEKTLIEVTHDARFEELMGAALREGKTISIEIEQTFPEEKTLKVQGVPMPQDLSLVTGLLVISDLSEIQRLMRLRNEFVANVSHELRTPLTSISGFIETLLSGAYKDTSQSERFLKIMEQDSKRLSRLIDELLQLSQIESKRVELEIMPVKICDVLNEVTALFQEKIAEKNIDVAIKGDVAIQVDADADKLKQVVVNLFDNAVKFNSSGGKVGMEVKVNDRMVKTSIVDSGCGIPSEALPRIFERFYRVDKARSREFGGTGLGLSIVKHLVEYQGGKVSCTSELDKGTRIEFTLPLAKKEMKS